MHRGAYSEYHMVEYQPRKNGRAVGEVQYKAIDTNPREWLGRQTKGSVTLLASWPITSVHYAICSSIEPKEIVNDY